MGNQKVAIITLLGATAYNAFLMMSGMYQLTTIHNSEEYRINDIPLLAPAPAETVEVVPIDEAQEEDTTTETHNTHRRLSHEKKVQQDTSLMILPFELPGYTGWSRPIHTLADCFQIVQDEDLPLEEATIGKNWTVKVECKHPAAANGGALFYVRAYGRALLPGTITDHKNGSYTIHIVPHDVGSYTVELVLTFSQSPSFLEMPNKRDKTNPSYEGYMLPGFPLTVTAVEEEESPSSSMESSRRLDTPSGDNNNTVLQGLLGDKEEKQPWNKNLPMCSANHLMETSNFSPLTTGRWLVTNKSRSNPYPTEPIENYMLADQISIPNYKNSKTSIGIQMDYFYNDCNVLSYANMVSADVWLEVIEKTQAKNNNKAPLHILYVGDSNTRNQYNFFRDHIGIPLKYLDGKIKLSYIDMMSRGDFDKVFETAKKEIKKLTHNPSGSAKEDNFFVLYNAGLHELMRGGEQYVKDVKQLTGLIQSFPATLRVWQSSTAGWPKWGMYLSC